MTSISALIGDTGFVGSNIKSQRVFEFFYNSSNIEDSNGKSFDLVVCAAAPGTKWLANKNPDADRASIERLIQNLGKISAKKFILISTIDVYSPAYEVNEDSKPGGDSVTPYGKHRLLLEEFIQSHFNSLAIRLPGIFGTGLKKNIIFDLMNGKRPAANNESTFQFYFLDYLWKDIQKCLDNNLSIINFATEPISVKELINNVLKLDIPPGPEAMALYDMRTNYASLWGHSEPYLYLKNEVMSDILSFIDRSKSKTFSSTA